MRAPYTVRALSAERAATHPGWVPRRWLMYQRRSRSSRWFVLRPERLLGFWLSVVLLSLLGIALVVADVMPEYFLPAFIVPAVLNLGADLVYIPRAFRAWRRHESHGS